MKQPNLPTTRRSRLLRLTLPLTITTLIIAGFLTLAQTASMQSLRADKNSSPAVIGYTISGNVQADGANLSGATVSLTGSSSATTTTNAGGNYSFTVAAGGTYTISVYKNGYKFDPASQTFVNVQTNQIGNFLNGTPLCAPSSANMVGWYKGEVNLTDSSGNGNTLTSANGAGYITGKVGQGFNLNAFGIYFYALDSVSLSPTSQITLDAWVYPTSAASGAVISKYERQPNQVSYALLLSGGKVQLNLSSDGSNARDIISDNVVVPVGVYSHVAATFDTNGQTAHLYVNGVEVTSSVLTGSSSIPSIFDSTSWVRIGGLRDAIGNHNSQFVGIVDEPQIYNRALSASEIAAISNAGSAGVCSSSLNTRTGTGTLDKTFNSTGKVLTTINGTNDYVNSVAIQTDGKIVAGGGTYFNGKHVFALARYNTDGSLDTSFGGTGKVTTPFGYSDGATSIALQTDGKIVAVGVTLNSAQTAIEWGIARYNTDGSLDTSFGGTGKISTSVGSSSSVGSVAIQPDGKIVTAGYAYVNSVAVNALVRYNTDGSLDTSFGGTGKITTLVGNYNSGGQSVTVQSDGKIVVAGFASNGSSQDFALVRYNTDGSLDTNFSGTGKILMPLGNYNDYAHSVKVQTDGKIVVAGQAYRDSDGYVSDFAIARYNSNGSLDTSFGGTGKIITSVGIYSSAARSVAIQTDGRIVATGFGNDGTNSHFTLVRYNTNGSLDTRFGSGGQLITPIASSNDGINSVAIQPDGRIVAAGTGSNSGSNGQFILARFNADTANIVIANNLSADFGNLSVSGSTTVTTLTASQIPALPNGYNLYSGASIYDIRTSASYSGNITVTETVSNVSSASICSALRLLHFENGAWTTNTNAAPVYNSGAQTCTLTQTVTSLSPFAVVQLAAPTAGEVSVSGRVLTETGRGLINATVYLTDASGATRSARTSTFGYYHFDDLKAGQTVTMSVGSKKYRFTPQVVNLGDSLADVNFTGETRR